MFDRIVLHHEKMGVYLGSAMGLGFWSALDPVGQEHAVTFTSRSQAKEVVASWEDPIADVQFVGIRCREDTYASIAEIVAIGLPNWDPNG